MTKIFILWITLQLILIGMASVGIDNEIKNKTYNCDIKVQPIWAGAILPLAAFIPEPKNLTDYCYTH